MVLLMFIDVKLNLWTYARMTTSASASGESSNLLMVVGVMCVFVLCKNFVYIFGFFECVVILSVCVEGLMLKVLIVFFMEVFVFFVF